MKNRRILIVAESIDINDSSGTKGRVALIRNLQKLGYDLRVLHYTRRPVSLDGLECISIPETRLSFNFLLSRIRRIFFRYTKIDLFKKIETIQGFSFSFFNDSLSIRKGVKANYKGEDLVITFSKGASFRPHHAVLKIPGLHSKWMAYVHDPYPFHLYPPPYDWVEPGHKKKEAFFRSVSEHAAYSVFPSKLLKEWMGQFFPGFLKSGIVVPHQNLKVESGNISAYPEYFDPDKFNLLHAGNLMKPRNPSWLINAYRKFLERQPSAKDDSSMIYLGTVDYFNDLFKEETKNIPSLYCSFGYVPYEIVHTLQNNTSVNVIIESKSEISPFLPGKFPHCVMADRPILLLSPEKSEVSRLLGDDYPFASSIDDEDALVLMIEKLYLLWKQDSKALRLNRKDLEDYLGLDYLKRQFESVLA